MTAFAFRRAVGLGFAAALALTCVTMLASRGRASVGRVEMLHTQQSMTQSVASAKSFTQSLHKQLTMAESIAAAKKIQTRNAVTSAYTPIPHIQQKHAAHRAAAKVVPASAVRTRDESAEQVADDFSAMEEQEEEPAVERAHVPVPADYARGLIVQPGHQDMDGFELPGKAAAAPAQAARSRRSTRPTVMPAAAAQAQTYNNDQNVKVVTGLEGDNVASGIGGGVGGQAWVRARKARIAADRGDEPAAEEPAAKTARAVEPAHTAAAHPKGRSAAKHHVASTWNKSHQPSWSAHKGHAKAPQEKITQHPRNFASNFDNDAGIKQVKGTEGDSIASGMGGSIDGQAWVAARNARIARERGDVSPVGAKVPGANTLKGEIAYPRDQGADTPASPVRNAVHQPTQEDVERVVGTNIVFHNVHNEGGIASGRQRRRVGIRYDDREMY